LLALTVAVIQAQEEETGPQGTIRGVVYEDVDGDGQCVDTGVAGEEPITDVNIEFVSSDGETEITLYTGSDGSYGLAAAGESNWAVTVQPGPEWVVTSEETLYAPVYEDSLVQTGINFCLQRGERAVIILPASGAASNAGAGWTILAIIFAMGLIVTGLGLEWRRHYPVSS
jgi:hypothetical protein